MYYLYIVRCSDNSLYCGTTTDLERRITEHNSSKKGAKYTRGRQPVQLVYCEELEDISAALKREVQIKKLSRKAKEKLLHI